MVVLKGRNFSYSTFDIVCKPDIKLHHFLKQTEPSEGFTWANNILLPGASFFTPKGSKVNWTYRRLTFNYQARKLMMMMMRGGFMFSSLKVTSLSLICSKILVHFLSVIVIIIFAKKMAWQLSPVNINTFSLLRLFHESKVDSKKSLEQLTTWLLYSQLRPEEEELRKKGKNLICHFYSF